MEKLIVLGAKQVTLMGWCGAIDPDFAIGDIVVPVGAVCGEGTSRYYSDEKRPRPSRAGCEVLFKLLSAEKLDWKEGIVWSTDAPYRESRTLLRRLHDEEQVIGVDMEFSALCSVASYRKIDFSAVLIVSDEVWSSTWKPGFKDKMFQERCRRLLDGLLHNFS
jgi:uridine phosphorylase